MISGSVARKLVWICETSGKCEGAEELWIYNSEGIYFFTCSWLRTNSIQSYTRAAKLRVQFVVNPCVYHACHAGVYRR